jgi:hypothetical protein
MIHVFKIFKNKKNIEKLSKKKKNILKELYETEKNYVECLKLLLSIKTITISEKLLNS